MTAAAIVCTSCGAEPARAGARFCDACGGALPAPARAEFKQVTVLFADVVGSMDIAAAVGAERLREIMAGVVGRGAAVVQRYGGTMDKFTGDGLMAVFGAPKSLEDHAIRACLAALDLQSETLRLADEVQRRDGIDLELRVGLNSGQVVAGEIGSGVPGYTAIGEQVGFAQRMESAAPPGGVMLSESTAHLVDKTAVLADPELVRIKGRDEPVPARRLFAVVSGHGAAAGTESTLVGRRWEMAALEAMVEQAIRGRGDVVGMAGPPGIGKSRVAREAAALAMNRGFEVVWTYCESHAKDVPFLVVSNLLRTVIGVTDLDGTDARARIRERIPDADPQDLLLLDDLLGAADPDVALPPIDPDARRRRLTALINAASLARTTPALYIIEDAHWIDAVSESMLTDFLTALPRTLSMALITCRPEYEGALTRVPGAQTIALAPLDDSETVTLLAELLGPDPSVGELGEIMVSRVGGIPFFAEEIVRDLTERGVLRGQRGAYVCRTPVTEVSVPATLQATIGARIDRLDAPAKRVLSAAAVIGSRFDTELLTGLGVEPVVDELIGAELIDQVRFTPRAQYAFHHPLIRAVAYESQLKSDRAEWHRRLAVAIQQRDPDSVDESAALIAEHLQAAGDLRAAYDWHMRASAWSTNRDITAARVSWERARQIADALPDDDPGRTAMRIAPRTMLSVSSWRAAESDSSERFEELRDLCTGAGDKASLAIGMTGPVSELMWSGHTRDASRLASEQMALLESIADPALTIGAAYGVMVIKAAACEIADLLHWSQTVIDLADGDPTKGANFAMGSPLAAAIALRGFGRSWLGRPGWREDFDDASAMARRSDPVTHALLITGINRLAIENGVLRADEFPLREIEETLRIAERSSGDTALSTVKLSFGAALTYRSTLADRRRGLELVTQVRDTWLRERTRLYLVPTAELAIARERAGRGERDRAIAMMRSALEKLFQMQQLGLCVVPTADLVEALLERRADGDIAEAQRSIDRLVNMPDYAGSAVCEIWLLRLRALLCRARGEDIAYQDFVNRYRTMADSLGFERHIAMAEAM
ncbi:MAG TPA: adenylate/guanylate cyclase domain-containing protein [Mycobacterium sp.]|nr:adenylate/guanylate cyclase domain-containing protein [Mycobacterium sp.]